MPAAVPGREEAVRKEPEETMPAAVPCREEVRGTPAQSEWIRKLR